MGLLHCLNLLQRLLNFTIIICRRLLLLRHVGQLFQDTLYLILVILQDAITNVCQFPKVVELEVHVLLYTFDCFSILR